MTVSPTIELAEMVKILREQLAIILKHGIDDITVVSCGKPVLLIREDGLVEGSDFRHRAEQ